MFSVPQYTSTELQQYNFFVMQDPVFEEKIEEPVFTHVYEENGVLYCASSTSKGVYWYTYCLNNPLRFTDPSGYFYNPDDYVPPDPKGIGPNGEFQYLFFGTNRGDPGNTAGYGASFGEKMYYTSSFRPGEAGPTYDYVYNWSTGQYDEFYGSGSLSQSDWSSSSLSQMGYKGRSASSLTDAYNQLGYVTTVFGTDALGNQDVGILNTTTDHMTVYKIPFWEITGSYFNELYYFSGLVAFDIYKAQRELVATGASVDLTIAIGPIGFSIEVGSIEQKGGVHRFFSIGHAYGLEASISMNSISIREYPSSSFSPQNYAGWNTTKNNSFTYFTYGRESALQYTQSPYFTYGYKANQYSFGLGVLPIGWSEARTYTWVGKRRERYQYNFYDFK